MRNRNSNYLEARSGVGSVSRKTKESNSVVESGFRDNRKTRESNSVVESGFGNNRNTRETNSVADSGIGKTREFNSVAESSNNRRTRELNSIADCNVANNRKKREFNNASQSAASNSNRKSRDLTNNVESTNRRSRVLSNSNVDKSKPGASNNAAVNSKSRDVSNKSKHKVLETSISASGAIALAPQSSRSKSRSNSESGEATYLDVFDAESTNVAVKLKVSDVTKKQCRPSSGNHKFSLSNILSSRSQQPGQHRRNESDSKLGFFRRELTDGAIARKSHIFAPKNQNQDAFGDDSSSGFMRLKKTSSDSCENVLLRNFTPSNMDESSSSMDSHNMSNETLISDVSLDVGGEGFASPAVPHFVPSSSALRRQVSLDRDLHLYSGAPPPPYHNINAQFLGSSSTTHLDQVF